MTGYGSGSAKVPGGRITVEVKSVNARFLDVSMKGPREYVTLERTVVKRVRKAVRRGKVDVFVNKSLDPSDPHAVQVDPALAGSYSHALAQLAEAIGSEERPSLGLVAGMRGVLVVGGMTPDAEHDATGLEQAVGEAVTAMVAMREEEGKSQAADLLENVSRLEELTNQLDARAPEIVKEAHASLKERVQALLEDRTLDEDRMAQEIAVLAEKTDIHEELVRLRSHLEQLRQFVDQGGEIGRRLDFLLQEVHREINTSGSKANDSESSRIVVEMKGVAERLREQVQNVE